MIRVTLDQRTVAAGAFLTGSLRWEAEDDRRVHRIVVSIEWRTDGAGNIARGVPRSKVFHLRQSQREASFPFRLLVPYDGPVTFEGELITVSWKVCAQVDQKGFDEFGESDFRVEPRREARLGAARTQPDSLTG